MISVVLYGRNDSYGYNLHKRAVLSLNCMAEVLDDPDDEIIFVDYNTPDDLPTFVDAVYDTITKRARDMLHVIRVRPAHHAAFEQRTHLKALESPSRNAAIRRSNPRNRWILSTNTDMVFIPRKPGSLSTIAAGLPDGFYHTPRFEVPEILWEALDRMDPKGTIDSIARWGERLQLQEVVYGAPETLFDGPGDFQLILRSDAFAISGFDERMLLGWHVDSNIAKRIAIHRNEPVKSALDHILAFHCDHNRESTPAHAHGAVQNDWGTYVTNVADADIEEQRTSWGFAGIELEEFRAIDRAASPQLLESLVPPMTRPFTMTSIEMKFYQDLRYEPDHVIPYVANAIGALPRSWHVTYAGCRKRTFAAFRRLWETLGFTGNIFVTQEVAERILDLTSDGVVRVVPEQEAHAIADLFVFEAGASEDDARPPVFSNADLDAGIRPLSFADYTKFRLFHRAYVRAQRAERESDRPARRFVLINMQSNPCDFMVESFVGASATPVSSRVRHGFQLPDPLRAPRTDPVTWMQSRLRGSWRPGRDTLIDIAGKIRARAGVEAFEKYIGASSELIAMLRDGEAPAALGADTEMLAALADAVEQRRPASLLGRATGIGLTPSVPARAALSRTIAIEDFDDPAWGKIALRVTGVKSILHLEWRGRHAWVASHLVYVLEQTGKLGGNVMLLQHPSDDTKTSQLLSSTLIDWCDQLSVYDATQPLPGGGTVDAVIVSPAAAVSVGSSNLPAVLTAADQMLKDGGVCVLLLDAAIGRSDERTFDLAQLRAPAFGMGLERETSWRKLGEPDLRLSARTVDTLGFGTGSEGAVRSEEGVLRLPVVLAFQKTGVTSRDAWDRYYAAFAGEPARTQPAASAALRR